MTEQNNPKNPLESLKEAGAAAAEVAKEFKERLQEERATAADDAAAATAAEKAKAVLKQATATAKAVAESEKFDEAKNTIAQALRTTTSQVSGVVSEKVSEFQERRGSREDAADSDKPQTEPQTPSAGAEHLEVLEGEVLANPEDADQATGVQDFGSDKS